MSFVDLTWIFLSCLTISLKIMMFVQKKTLQLFKNVWVYFTCLYFTSICLTRLYIILGFWFIRFLVSILMLRMSDQVVQLTNQLEAQARWTFLQVISLGILIFTVGFVIELRLCSWNWTMNWIQIWIHPNWSSRQTENVE